MSELFTESYVGVHTADAEQVQVRYVRGDLILDYIDWKEQPQSVTFLDTVAFRWQEYDDAETPRDDTTYEVIDSAWLQSQTPSLQDPEKYAHYKLCFNACGVLDLLCLRVNGNE